MHIRQLIKNKRFEVIKALVESKKIKQEWLEDLYSILLEQDADIGITQAKYEIIKLLLTEKKYLNF
jgi:arginine repressor